MEINHWLPKRYALRYPYKLFWLLARGPHVRCSDRQRLARELLQTPAEHLEANARKLKKAFTAEQEFLAEEGRFDMQSSPEGSRLFAVVSTMSELLKGDTQLVESVNSIIRLIGSRCPSIDLETMSARITTKKAVSRDMQGIGAVTKRWSSFSEAARPLLRELTFAGSDYKQVMNDTSRFSQPVRTTMRALDASLCNNNLAKALADLKSTCEKSWAMDHARRVKASMQASRQEFAKLRAFAALKPASVTVFCLRRTDKQQAPEFFAQLKTFRSLIFAAPLSLNPDGSFLLGDCMPIVTTLEILLDLHGSCHDDGAPATFEIKCFSAVHVSGTTLRCLEEKDQTDMTGWALRMCTLDAAVNMQKPIASISRSRATVGSFAQQARAALQDDLEELEDPEDFAEDEILRAGYGFASDVEDSGAAARRHDEELGTASLDVANTEKIRVAVSGEGGACSIDRNLSE